MATHRDKPQGNLSEPSRSAPDNDGLPPYMQAEQPVPDSCEEQEASFTSSLPLQGSWKEAETPPQPVSQTGGACEVVAMAPHTIAACENTLPASNDAMQKANPSPTTEPEPKIEAQPEGQAFPPLTLPAGDFSFSGTHPVLKVEQSMPASAGSCIFNAFALVPLLSLTLFLLLQTVFTLDARALWFSDEIRHADVFRNLLDHGHWLVLQMNGQPYPDKPPLYFWFLRGLYELLRTDGPMLHFTAAAVSGLLYLWATLGLGKRVARVDGRTNLAAGILLLTTGYVMGTLHYARMDLLFSAFIVCSHIFLYRALVRSRNAFFCMAVAFALAGAATLIKGPLGLAFPICSAVFFTAWRAKGKQAACVAIPLIALALGLLPFILGLPLVHAFGLLPETGALPFPWFLVVPVLGLLAGGLLLLLYKELRLCVLLSLLLMLGIFFLAGGTPYFLLPFAFVLPVALIALLVLWQITPQRLFRLDFYLGLVIGALIPCLWLGAIYLQTGNLDFILHSLLDTQVVKRAVDSFHHKEAWDYYLLRLPLMLLPWALLIIFLPWKKIFSKTTREALAASRRPEKEGVAFLWCMILSSLVLLSCLSGKILIYLLPILPAFALVAARALLGITQSRAAPFRFSMAGLLFVCGVFFAVASLMFFDLLPMPDIKGMPQWHLPFNIGFFVVAGILCLGAFLILCCLRSSRPEGVMLLVLLTATALSYPLAGMVAPAFDAVLSPKAQALLMRGYINAGYKAASHGAYGGTYAFYSGTVVPELNTLDEAAALAAEGPVVLAIQHKRLTSWENMPTCLEEVHRQWIETKEFVLLACPPKAEVKPAAPPYRPAPDLWALFRGAVVPPVVLPAQQPEIVPVPLPNPTETPVPQAVPSPADSKEDPAQKNNESPGQQQPAPIPAPAPLPGTTGTHTPHPATPAPGGNLSAMPPADGVNKPEPPKPEPAPTQAGRP